MFELGDEEAAEHLNIVKKALDTNVTQRIFIGKAFFRQKAKDEGQKATFYETAEEAISALKTLPIKNSTVLIKGSRGMALERLVELL